MFVDISFGTSIGLETCVISMQFEGEVNVKLLVVCHN